MTEFSATQITAAKLVKASYKSFIFGDRKLCETQLVEAAIRIGELLELLKEKKHVG